MQLRPKRSRGRIASICWRRAGQGKAVVPPSAALGSALTLANGSSRRSTVACNHNAGVAKCLIGPSPRRLAMPMPHVAFMSNRGAQTGTAEVVHEATTTEAPAPQPQDFASAELVAMT